MAIGILVIQYARGGEWRDGRRQFDRKGNTGRQTGEPRGESDGRGATNWTSNTRVGKWPAWIVIAVMTRQSRPGATTKARVSARAREQVATDADGVM